MVEISHKIDKSRTKQTEQKEAPPTFCQERNANFIKLTKC
jgi:hypothetical protein